MPANRSDLLSFLAGLGIDVVTTDHAPVFTVEESRDLRGTIPGAHSKNLFLKDRKGALFLLVTLEDADLDLKSLHRTIGARGRLSFGNAGLLGEALGVEPGSVTPFAAINDAARRVTVILDEALMAHPRLNFHPLENNATTTIARDDLVRFLEATGHAPRLLALSAGTADVLPSADGTTMLQQHGSNDTGSA